MSDLPESSQRLLVRQTINSWIKVGIAPSDILSGVEDAFSHSSALVEWGYEVYNTQLEPIKEHIRAASEHARVWD